MNFNYINYEFEQFVKYPSDDNYQFFRGFVSGLFFAKALTEELYDEYLDKARKIKYAKSE